jgi:hypothetical protein
MGYVAPLKFPKSRSMLKQLFLIYENQGRVFLSKKPYNPT